ncbi:MAG: hypothetical protein AAF211_00315 [Myxococcota bacterium]
MTRPLVRSLTAILLAIGGCGPGEPDCEDCPEICDNGVDDDGNGLVDCDDVEACPEATVANCAFEPPACSADVRDEIPEIVADAVQQRFTLANADVAARGRIEVPGDRDCFALRVSAGTHYMIGTAHENDNPDTVLQLLDSDFEKIAENDDAIYQMLGSDSVLELFAQRNETLYLQVMEASELDEAAEPEGGRGYRYDLRVAAVDGGELYGDANDTLEQGLANLYGTSANSHSDPLLGRYQWVPGRIDPAGDEDIYVFGLNRAVTCQWSFLPHDPRVGWSSRLSSLAPLLEVYYEACEPTVEGDCTAENVTLVASTDDPVGYPRSAGSTWWFDGGVTFPAPGAGVLYARVSDRAGTGSDLHGYSLLVALDTLDERARDEESGSDNPADATPTQTGNNGGGGITAYVSGALDGSTTMLPDTMDSFAFPAGPAEARYAHVFLETEQAGSLFTDPVVRLWRDHGDGTATELTVGTGDGQAIRNFLLPEPGPLFVSVESASGAEGPGIFYLLRVATTIEALEAP